jgi:hypothetical protein
MPLTSLLLFALGGAFLIAGIAAAFLLPAPDGGLNLWYLIPGLVLGTTFEFAGVVVAILTRRTQKR